MPKPTCRARPRPLYYRFPHRDERSGMADERIEILGRVPLFDGLSEKELAAVANAAKERRYDTGDVVVGEGEQFTPLLEQHPQLAIKVAKLLARRLRETEERLGAS